MKRPLLKGGDGDQTNKVKIKYTTVSLVYRERKDLLESVTYLTIFLVGGKDYDREKNRGHV